MDDRYMYVFVRQDLTLQQQLVHSNHATFCLATLVGREVGAPNLILIGVPDESALGRVKEKLKNNQVQHYIWSDPDFPELGPTAITTEPLDESRKSSLAKYRLWRDARENPKTSRTATAPGDSGRLSGESSLR